MFKTMTKFIILLQTFSSEISIIDNKQKQQQLIEIKSININELTKHEDEQKFEVFSNQSEIYFRNQGYLYRFIDNKFVRLIDQQPNHVESQYNKIYIHPDNTIKTCNECDNIEQDLFGRFDIKDRFISIQEIQSVLEFPIDLITPSKVNYSEFVQGYNNGFVQKQLQYDNLKIIDSYQVDIENPIKIQISANDDQIIISTENKQIILNLNNPNLRTEIYNKFAYFSIDKDIIQEQSPDSPNDLNILRIVDSINYLRLTEIHKLKLNILIDDELNYNLYQNLSILNPQISIITQDNEHHAIEMKIYEIQYSLDRNQLLYKHSVGEIYDLKLISFYNNIIFAPDSKSTIHYQNINYLNIKSSTYELIVNDNKIMKDAFDGFTQEDQIYQFSIQLNQHLVFCRLQSETLNNRIEILSVYPDKLESIANTEFSQEIESIYVIYEDYNQIYINLSSINVDKLIRVNNTTFSFELLYTNDKVDKQSQQQFNNNKFYYYKYFTDSNDNINKLRIYEYQEFNEENYQDNLSILKKELQMNITEDSQVINDSKNLRIIILLKKDNQFEFIFQDLKEQSQINQLKYEQENIYQAKLTTDNKYLLVLQKSHALHQYRLFIQNNDSRLSFQKSIIVDQDCDVNIPSLFNINDVNFITQEQCRWAHFELLDQSLVKYEPTYPQSQSSFAINNTNFGTILSNSQMRLNTSLPHVNLEPIDNKFEQKLTSQNNTNSFSSITIQDINNTPQTIASTPILNYTPSIDNISTTILSTSEEFNCSIENEFEFLLFNNQLTIKMISSYGIQSTFLYCLHKSNRYVQLNYFIQVNVGYGCSQFSPQIGQNGFRSCTECQMNYDLIETDQHNQCKQKNCIEQTDGKCDKCIDGMTFDQTLGMCNGSCESQGKGVCSKCSAGYIQEGSFCFQKIEFCEEQEGLICNRCDIGLTFDQTRNICNGLCQIQNSVEENCEQCADGYKSQGKQCFPNVEFCEKQNGRKCEKCISGMTFDQTNNICNGQCEIYDESLNICSSCAIGYKSQGNHCIPSIPYCIDQFNLTCTSCYTGMSYNPIQNICNGQCENQDSLSSVCSICATGQIKNQDEYCIPSIENCLNQSGVNCTSCINDYYLSEGVCRQNCIKTTNGICSECTNGYSLDSSGICKPEDVKYINQYQCSRPQMLTYPFAMCLNRCQVNVQIINGLQCVDDIIQIIFWLMTIQILYSLILQLKIKCTFPTQVDNDFHSDNLFKYISIKLFYQQNYHIANNQLNTLTDQNYSSKNKLFQQSTLNQQISLILSIISLITPVLWMIYLLVMIFDIIISMTNDIFNKSDSPSSNKELFKSTVLKNLEYFQSLSSNELESYCQSYSMEFRSIDFILSPSSLRMVNDQFKIFFTIKEEDMINQNEENEHFLPLINHINNYLNKQLDISTLAQNPNNDPSCQTKLFILDMVRESNQQQYFIILIEQNGLQLQTKLHLCPLNIQIESNKQFKKDVYKLIDENPMYLTNASEVQCFDQNIVSDIDQSMKMEQDESNNSLLKEYRESMGKIHIMSNSKVKSYQNSHGKYYNNDVNISNLENVNVNNNPQTELQDIYDPNQTKSNDQSSKMKKGENYKIQTENLSSIIYQNTNEQNLDLNSPKNLPYTSNVIDSSVQYIESSNKPNSRVKGILESTINKHKYSNSIHEQVNIETISDESQTNNEYTNEKETINSSQTKSQKTKNVDYEEKVICEFQNDSNVLDNTLLTPKIDVNDNQNNNSIEKNNIDNQIALDNDASESIISNNYNQFNQNEKVINYNTNQESIKYTTNSTDRISNLKNKTIDKMKCNSQESEESINFKTVQNNNQDIFEYEKGSETYDKLSKDKEEQVTFYSKTEDCQTSQMK